MELGDTGDETLPDRCRIEAWRPDVAGISEVFHAQIVDYAYPPHCHDTWAVLIVETGAISYEIDKRERDAFGQAIAVLPPGVTHDGQPAAGAEGFTKRVLYLDDSLLPADLVGAAVDQKAIEDPGLRELLADLHRDLSAGEDLFPAEAKVTMAADRITRHLRQDSIEAMVAEPAVARDLRCLLDQSIGTSITLTEASERLGRSKPHLIRTFSAAYGLAPHAYLIGRRVEAARKLLLEGMAPAEVAAMVGFL